MSETPDLYELARRTLQDAAAAHPNDPLGVHVRETMDLAQRTFASLIRKAMHEEVAALWPTLTEEQRTEAIRHETELTVRIHQIVKGSGKLPTHKRLREEITYILGPAPFEENA